MSTYNWPPKGGSGIAKYPTFADFPAASSVADGTLAIALDTQTLYESNGVTWTAIASPGAINTFDDTNSIDLTNTAGVITADLNLSAAATPGGNRPVELSILSDGLHAQINDLDIQVAVFVSDTPSVNMTNDGNSISADVVLSAAAAPAGSILSPLSIQADGLRAVTPIMVGDSGTGGVAGVVPAPGAGSAATGAFLKADGTWTVPAGTSASLAFAYGGGVDGNVTVNSPIGLTRDMYYNNLTITTGGQITTLGFRIFVAGILDLTTAPADAIVWNIPGTGDGGNGGVGTAGAAGPTVGSGSGATIGPAGSLNGTIGGTGTTSGGNQAPNGVASSIGANGSEAGNGGAGGNGNAANGGASRAAQSIATTRVGPMARFTADFHIMTNGIPNNIITLTGGMSGVGGSGGGSNGAGTGGGGGGGGSSRGIVYICCNVLKRTGAAVGCINANGDKGGNGGSAIAGISGGGGGGSGAGGGWVYLAYASLGDATPATNFITANGGAGGAGGNGFGGNGTTTGLGGNAGGGGGGGRITVFNLTSGAYIAAFGGVPTIGNTATGATGGAATAGQATGVTL